MPIFSWSWIDLSPVPTSVAPQLIRTRPVVVPSVPPLTIPTVGATMTGLMVSGVMTTNTIAVFVRSCCR